MLIDRYVDTVINKVKLLPILGSMMSFTEFWGEEGGGGERGGTMMQRGAFIGRDAVRDGGYLQHHVDVDTGDGEGLGS